MNIAIGQSLRERRDKNLAATAIVELKNPMKQSELGERDIPKADQ
jgi:hypothetical protein